MLVHPGCRPMWIRISSMCFNGGDTSYALKQALWTSWRVPAFTWYSWGDQPLSNFKTVMKCLPLIRLPILPFQWFGLPKAFQEADVLIQVWPDASSLCSKPTYKHNSSSLMYANQRNFNQQQNKSFSNFSPTHVYYNIPLSRFPEALLKIRGQGVMIFSEWDFTNWQI
jgi:hypothetical protein